MKILFNSFNNMFRNLIRTSRACFSLSKKEKPKYDFFEFEPFKYKEQQKKLYGNYTEEELFGLKDLGYESPKYRREVRSLYVNIFLISILVITYGYSFFEENREWHELNTEWTEKQLKKSRYYE